MFAAKQCAATLAVSGRGDERAAHAGGRARSCDLVRPRATLAAGRRRCRPRGRPTGPRAPTGHAHSHGVERKREWCLGP